MRIKHFLAGMAFVVLILAAYLTTPVGAQQVMRIYGTFNGNPIALLANSSGLLRVVIDGGVVGPVDSISFSGGSTLVGTNTNRLELRNGTNAQRFDACNTWSSATSFECFAVDWQTSANVAMVGTRTAATGTGRPLRLVSQVSSAADRYSLITLDYSAAPMIRGGIFTAGLTADSTGITGNWIQFGEGTSTATSGTISRFAITPTYNQASGTAANTDLLINRTQTAVGSGAQRLIDAQVGSVSQFSVTNGGVVQAAGSITANTDLIAANRYILASKALINVTAPTIASGFGSSPSVPANNGTAAFTVNVGTGGTASAGVITMPAAATGWNCAVENRTGVAANRANQRTVQTATTTTSVTVQNQTISTGAALAWTASDVLALTCMGY